MQEKTKLTRYCPECGHVGDVSATHISCCPDGSAAFDVPLKYAQELRNGFKALIASPQCLRQIQEPAAAEQAAWHAGLDEGRAQAAPAAVAVPDERAASIRYDVLHEFATNHRVDYNELCAMARAALAATPACDTPYYCNSVHRCTAMDEQRATAAAEQAVPKWIDDPHDIEQGQMLNPEWVKAQETAAAPVVAPEPVGIFSWGSDRTQPTFHFGRSDKERISAMLDEWASGGPYRTEFAYTEQQVRALLTAGGKAQAVEVDDSMALAFHHAITDGAIGQDDLNEIKIGLRAAQAAPAAVAVPDERAASIRYDVLHEFATNHRVDYNELCAMARAALAATPGGHLPNCNDDACCECSSLIPDEWVGTTPAAAPVVLPEPAMNEDGYLPCPFCGSDQVSKSIGKNGDGTPWPYVECESCAAMTEIGQWNERALLATGGQAQAFQQRVQPWMMACFGPAISADACERNHRFLEEALELVQSCGCTASEAHQLVDYVFGRPVGDKQQEVGGVMVTLAALCLAQDLDMHAAGDVELARIWTKVEAIRAKQAAKPKHSPLPEHAPQAQAGARDAELLRFLQDQCIDLRCFTTSDGEDVGWRTVQHHMSEPRERVVSEVYGDQPRRAIREAMARIERDPHCTGPLHLEDDAAIAAAKGQHDQ